jgi:FecR protein
MLKKWWFPGLMTIAATGAFGVLTPSQLDADPPARVGRLDYMTGAVSFRPAGSDEWAAAVPNRPLTTGDRLWTDNDSRAEVHVGSTVIRISSQTELDFTALDDNTLQMRLAQGSMNIRVRHLDDGQVYEIDAPNGAVSIGRPGEYRVDVGSDGNATVVSVWSGHAEVTSAGSSFAVNPRQQASIKGVDSPTYDLNDAPAPDAWDQWCVSRDQREDNAVSARYVSREMPGYDDLDAYGQWRYADGYGQVWVPANEPSGWAPYHTGHWVWVDPWGWTWVDDAPWGYAPYHYGRWAYIGSSWAWVPGQIAPRPVYAPALVVFVGGGPGPRPGGVAVAVGVGAAVAWFALGPQEVYHPAYATSPTYVRQVNVTNVTNVTNITVVNNTTNVTTVEYRNRMAPGAIAATSGTAFTSARPVQSAPIAVTHEMQTASPMSSAPAIAPTRASLGVVNASEAAKAPPTGIENRAVVANVAPPPAPIPFAAKQQALAANGGRPLAPAQEATIRQSSPALAAGNTLVKPASFTPAGGGLKPARGGLATAAPVGAGAGQGFVPRAVAATHPAVAQPASNTTNADGANTSSHPSTVPRPPDRLAPATATRVPSGGADHTAPASKPAASGSNPSPANHVVGSGVSTSGAAADGGAASKPGIGGAGNGAGNSAPPGGSAGTGATGGGGANKHHAKHAKPSPPPPPKPPKEEEKAKGK